MAVTLRIWQVCQPKPQNINFKTKDMNTYTAPENRSKFAIFIVIARYSLLSALALPFLIIGLVFDIIKLPVLILFLAPIWLMLDLAQWLKTGDFEITILSKGEIWYMGLAVIIEAFYG